MHRFHADCRCKPYGSNEDDIRKGVTKRFVLGVLKLRKIHVSQKQSNGRCLQICIYVPMLYMVGMAFRLHIHIGVGVCVARSDLQGNAKASDAGRAIVQLPRHFCMCMSNSTL